jgi:hypothetical protein
MISIGRAARAPHSGIAGSSAIRFVRDLVRPGAGPAAP